MSGQGAPACWCDHATKLPSTAFIRVASSALGFGFAGVGGFATGAGGAAGAAAAGAVAGAAGGAASGLPPPLVTTTMVAIAAPTITVPATASGQRGRPARVADSAAPVAADSVVGDGQA